MTTFWSGTVAKFLRARAPDITGALAMAQIRHFRVSAAQQLRAWAVTIDMLRKALTALPNSATELTTLPTGVKLKIMRLTCMIFMQAPDCSHSGGGIGRHRVTRHAVDVRPRGYVAAGCHGEDIGSSFAGDLYLYRSTRRYPRCRRLAASAL